LEEGKYLQGGVICAAVKVTSLENRMVQYSANPEPQCENQDLRNKGTKRISSKMAQFPRTKQGKVKARERTTVGVGI
jgi:hypothetical protein